MRIGSSSAFRQQGAHGKNRAAAHADNTRRMRTTWSVLLPNGIRSPGAHASSVVSNAGGSAGGPSSRSSLRCSSYGPTCLGPDGQPETTCRCNGLGATYSADAAGIALAAAATPKPAPPQTKRGTPPISCAG
jgi:hypothetical protein